MDNRFLLSTDYRHSILIHTCSKVDESLRDFDKVLAELAANAGEAQLCGGQAMAQLGQMELGLGLDLGLGWGKENDHLDHSDSRCGWEAGSVVPPLLLLIGTLSGLGWWSLSQGDL